MLNLKIYIFVWGNNLISPLPSVYQISCCRVIWSDLAVYHRVCIHKSLWMCLFPVIMCAKYRTHTITNDTSSGKHLFFLKELCILASATFTVNLLTHLTHHLHRFWWMHKITLAAVYVVWIFAFTHLVHSYIHMLLIIDTYRKGKSTIILYGLLRKKK